MVRARIIIAVAIGYLPKDDAYIIPRGTAIFFGLCASAFLPAFIGALFCKWITRAGAITYMIVGFVVTAFWLVLVKKTEADVIGVVYWFAGEKPSILSGVHSWNYRDSLFVALPLSIIAAIVVSADTIAGRGPSGPVPPEAGGVGRREK